MKSVRLKSSPSVPFDRAVYDKGADVLYLSIGEPRRALGEETLEGDVALFDEETGEFCGLTIIGARRAVKDVFPAPRLGDILKTLRDYPVVLEDLVSRCTIPTEDEQPHPSLGNGHHDRFRGR